MDDKRRGYLLKLALGKDFRRAVRAIAELSAARVPADALAGPRRLDEQRAFQLRIGRILLEQGVRGLVQSWTTLAEAHWRAELIDEVGALLGEDPAQIDLGIAALGREPERATLPRGGGSASRRHDAGAALPHHARTGRHAAG